MSVLIKGMEMPERCGEKCLAYDVDKNDGFPSCRASKYTGKPTFKAFHQNGVIFPDGCPLVEVHRSGGLTMDAYISREAALEALDKHRGLTPIAKLEAELVIVRVPAADVPCWISVGDRLPKQYEEVIVYHHSRVEAGRLDANGWWKIYGTRTKAVTHWMPLPEGPEKTNKR